MNIFNKKKIIRNLRLQFLIQMQNLNFNEIHESLVRLNWTWCNNKFKFETPSVDEIKECYNDLFESAVKEFIITGDSVVCETGGCMVMITNDKYVITRFCLSMPII